MINWNSRFPEIKSLHRSAWRGRKTPQQRWGVCSTLDKAASNDYKFTSKGRIGKQIEMKAQQIYRELLLRQIWAECEAMIQILVLFF